MRTVIAGFRTAQRAPLALVPLAAEGALGALLLLVGFFPEGAASAPATAVFPLDVYFDLKQSLAVASGWIWVAIAAVVSVVARSAVLAATLWLAEGAPGPFLPVWQRTSKLCLVAVGALFPAASMFFIGVATRYAPFLWVGAALGFVPAALLARRAALLDVGSGPPPGKGVPEIAGWLGYAYLVAVLGAALSVLGRAGTWLAALLLLFVGPIHALFILGWRGHLENETYPGGGTLAVAATVIIGGGLLAGSLYDRWFHNPPPVGEVNGGPTLVVLGGVDSTSSSGALADFDARDVGLARNSSRLLSYTSDEDYGRDDTHEDLGVVAGVVAEQIDDAARPVLLLGHSQAALILDRILDGELTAPNGAVVLAPSVPTPPSITVPPPDVHERGKPGGDIARAFSHLMDWVGFTPPDVDAPASPTNLDALVIDQPEIPRLAVWALGDSVWLEGDWRRPGEVNIVSLTDHVGATRDVRAIEAARDFFARRTVPDDRTSWRGMLVSVLRYSFEPWRPR